jgi:hypothetical protein
MFERLQHRVCGWHVLLALLVFVIALIGMNLAATHFYHITGGYGILDLGGGANLLDDRGSYTPARAYSLIAHYGSTGMHYYYRLLIADCFFPPIFGVFTLLGIVWALTRLAPQPRWPYILVYVPLAYVLSDWVENTGIVAMLLHYPHKLYTVASVTNWARAIKSVLADSSLVLALGGGLLVVWRRVRERHHA